MQPPSTALSSSQKKRPGLSGRPAKYSRVQDQSDPRTRPIDSKCSRRQTGKLNDEHKTQRPGWAIADCRLPIAENNQRSKLDAVKIWLLLGYLQTDIEFGM
jgi:hypothetical protein